MTRPDPEINSTRAPQTPMAHVTPDNIDEYLDQHQKKELLRFVAVGSVDDGKSTLIGRLLHDTKGIYEDQLSAVKKASSKGTMEIDFSLFTDGLKAEREQGITIDVAYRYFSTDRRKFIIADTPGHEQYTRNMATGASTANVAIILIDARLGVLAQSRRHAYIASLLGIPHLLVAVNKLDLENYSQDVFERIKADFQKVADRLAFKDVTFIPISAKVGDNVVELSDCTPWYRGTTLLEFLETVPIASDRNQSDFRFPVQIVLRPNLDYRGFSGEIAAGKIGQGDEVLVLPSRKKSKVVAIDTFERQLTEAAASTAVTLRLEHEIDISRGDMLVHPSNVPHVDSSFDAHVVWMGEKPLDPGKSYLLKHTTRVVRANVESINSVTDLATLDAHPASELKLNDIGSLRVKTHQPLYFDAYTRSRATGAFILIDSLTNNTVAAGMIIGPSGAAAVDDAASTSQNASQVSKLERATRLGQTGAVVFVSGEHSEAFAVSLERSCFDRGLAATLASSNDELAQSFDGTSDGALARLADAGLIAVVPVLPGAGKARFEKLGGYLGSARCIEVALDGGVTVAGHKVVSDASDAEHAAGAVANALADALLVS